VTDGARRTLAAFAATAVAVAAVVAIVAIVHGRFGDRDARVVASVAATLLVGGAALAGLQLIEARTLPLLGVVVLVVAAAAAVAFAIGIWEGQTDPANDAFKLVPTAVAWTVATLVVATLPFAAHEPRVLRLVLPAVAACAAAGATLATVLVWAEIEDEPWGKTLATLATAMTAGYLGAPALSVLVRSREPSERGL